MPKSWNKQINLSALPQMLHGSADIFYLPFQSKSGTTRLHFSLSKNRLLKQYNEVYCQHRWKHFPYRQGVNIFVSISVQLHWHWPFKKTPLTWDICTNLRTCSVKRSCIDRIYNVQVVIQVPLTPRRGGGVSKERGSHEGENLRDRERGCQVPCPSLFGSFPR